VFIYLYCVEKICSKTKIRHVGCRFFMLSENASPLLDVYSYVKISLELREVFREASLAKKNCDRSVLNKQSR
jgi:hypothetical protein